jgi:hypothetical protein
MADLIPQQRADRNGKIVTRHVRATPQQAAGRSAMPKPSVGAPDQNKAAQKAFKLRPAQLKQAHQSHPARVHDLDERLMTDEERGSGISHNLYYGFEASEVDIYDVLSVAPPGAALRMLAHGVRTADEARAYLIERNAADLITDNYRTAREALEKNVSHYDFLDTYSRLDSDTGRASEHLVDAVRFASTSLNSGVNSLAEEDILSGHISFDDIKAVGVTQLKPHNRLSSLQVTFRKMKRGEGDYTIDGIKELIKRSSDENIQSREFNYVCRAMDHLGQEKVLGVKHLFNLANAFHHFKIAPGASKFEDGIERALYLAHFKEGVNNPRMIVSASDEFYDAGIPVELAIAVAANGGGAREAMAIHEEGIESSLSGGWL